MDTFRTDSPDLAEYLELRGVKLISKYMEERIRFFIFENVANIYELIQDFNDEKENNKNGLS